MPPIKNLVQHLKNDNFVNKKRKRKWKKKLLLHWNNPRCNLKFIPILFNFQFSLVSFNTTWNKFENREQIVEVVNKTNSKCPFKKCPNVNVRGLCNAVALLAEKSFLKRCCGNDGSLVACKLISLDKNPGLRPIGIAEVIRRILGRTVVRTFRRNILESEGDLQICAGQRVGCEAALHALSSTFSEDDSDAILLVQIMHWFK